MTPNTVNLEEQIKLLVELQELDSQILKIKRELEFIPEQMKELEDKFTEEAINLKKCEDELKTIQLKRKEKELDLESKEGGIKKYQSQLYQIKTNKEYSALQQEIERAKADNSLIEEEILKILDQIDTQNQKIAKEKELLKASESNYNEEKKKKAEESKQLESQLEGLNGGRAALTPKIDKIILSKYERISKNKDGLAVVPVVNEACNGCFRIMPPQVTNEIKMKRDLVLCDNCSRILYIEE